ncbi:unnamed protein product [Notodromas monacha]|uniref:O-acyltransferase WSD1 C-terminal domain-containing protein n=1 Tax=Notodromas monacha TaxID=399045 RepID=A0A7R9G898_9CRUS|nr:unnamed protein product [Notodromas monacha]CAG0912923.1 unnamed protein product [Notodromas monacha]
MACLGALAQKSMSLLGLIFLTLPYMLFYCFVKMFLMVKPGPRMKLFSRSDAVWLCTGSADPVHWVRVVFMLNGPVDLREVQLRVHNNLVTKHLKLRSRVAKFAGFDVWQRVERFDIANHVKWLTREGEQAVVTFKTQRELIDVINWSGRMPHDPNLPLWRMQVIPMSSSDTKRTAVVFAFSHSIMDGNSLWLSVYPALSDGPIDAPDVGKSLGWRRRMALCAGALASVKKSVKQQFSMPDMNPVKETGRETGMREVMWPEMFDFKEFRGVTKKFDCSINDVFTSCFTGAILRQVLQFSDALNIKFKLVFCIDCRYCEDIASYKGIKPDWEKWKLSTTVPVSFWAKDEKPVLKNNVAISRVILPTDKVSPEERLMISKHACDKYLKSSAHPWTLYMLSNSTPIPKWLTVKGVGILEPVVTLCCTNVKGPSKKLSFFGCEVEDILFFSTLCPDRSPDILICMMSYNGRIGVQATVRRPVLPDNVDVGLVQAYFREELAALNAAASAIPSIPEVSSSSVTIAVELDSGKVSSASSDSDELELDVDDVAIELEFRQREPRRNSDCDSGTVLEENSNPSSVTMSEQPGKEEPGFAARIERECRGIVMSSKL